MSDAVKLGLVIEVLITWGGGGKRGGCFFNTCLFIFRTYREKSPSRILVGAHLGEGWGCRGERGGCCHGQALFHQWVGQNLITAQAILLLSVKLQGLLQIRD